MSRGRGTPSLRTVAEAAGVSMTTVSNAYNKPERLSVEVRDMIFAIARKQGYAGPNPFGRSLRNGRAGAVAMLFTVPLSYAFSDPYCVELLTGVAEACERGRTRLMLIPIGPANAADIDLESSIEAVRYAAVDGAVADGIDDDHPALRVLRDRGLPVVGSTLDCPGPCVAISDHAAGVLIGTHLGGLGHRDIAVVVDSADSDSDSADSDSDAADSDSDSDGGGGAVAGPATVPRPADESTLYPYSRLRVAGIRDGAGDARVSVVAAGANTAAAGAAAARRLLDRVPRPTAVAAVSDVLALGVLAALAEAGHAGELSVTGFDDIPAAAASGLTTVRQPVREKGRVMGRMLLDPSTTGERVELPTSLIIRTSSGAPHRSSPVPGVAPLTPRE